MAKCKHCGKDGSHFCSKLQRHITEEADSGDFLLSMAVAMASDSALLGYAVGGDLVGAIVGDALSSDSSDGGDFGGGSFE